jgi:ABC-type branched-subunit amino acid transport system ATPase component
MSAIRIESVTKRFGDILCLNEAHLAVRGGERVAIVGNNGSGKTTLLDVLSGFQMPDSGRVLVDSRLANGRQATWFSKQGVLRTFQSPRVFEQMTIGECLHLSGWVPEPPGIWAAISRNSHYSHRQGMAEQQTQRMLREVNWEGSADQQAGELSYGQRKFLTILQLVSAEGNVAVCDEPTAGLDSGQAARVISLLRNWQSSKPQRALIVATHDLEYVREAFDRAYRMSNGRLVEM